MMHFNKTGVKEIDDILDVVDDWDKTMITEDWDDQVAWVNRIQKAANRAADKWVEELEMDT